MLNKNDLQSMRQLIKEEVPPIVTKLIKEEVPPIVRKLIKEEVPPFIKKELKPIKSKLNRVDKKLDTVIKFFDREVINLGKRVDRVEQHLNLEPYFPL